MTKKEAEHLFECLHTAIFENEADNLSDLGNFHTCLYQIKFIALNAVCNKDFRQINDIHTALGDFIGRTGCSDNPLVIELIHTLRFISVGRTILKRKMDIENIHSNEEYIVILKFLKGKDTPSTLFQVHNTVTANIRHVISLLDDLQNVGYVSTKRTTGYDFSYVITAHGTEAITTIQSKINNGI